MPQVVIENPVINSPYAEPGRHFKFADDGITDEIIEQRRISQYFIPIAAPKLYRIAFKMATGSGKTLVMGMLIVCGFAFDRTCQKKSSGMGGWQCCPRA
jgi:hypothetical protein